MPWHTTTDLDRFDAAAGALLRTRPIENTILLTTLDTLHRRGGRAYGDEPPRYGWWAPDGRPVGGAFLHTPPYPLVLSHLPGDAIGSFVDMVVDGGRAGGRVNTGSALAKDLAARLLARTGAPVSTGRGSRLYRLDTLVPPEPAPPGSARLARPDDRALLIAWYEQFGREVGEGHPDPSTVVDERTSFGDLMLWQDGDAVVSLAGCARPQVGVVRVGPVYTPAPRRRRGYAAAVTAALSRRIVDGGAEAVLFTDLANPTSNAIYQRLGYRPVEDRVIISW
jgi:FR47-like protein